MKQFVLIKDISTFNKHIYCSKDTENRNGACFCNNRYLMMLFLLLLLLLLLLNLLQKNMKLENIYIGYMQNNNLN